MVTRVVLLPGMDGTGELFAGFVRTLPVGLRADVVRYPRDRRLSYDELLKRVLGELSGEDFVVVAESFSVPLAIRLAALQPVGLKGVVLVAGFARSPVARWLRPVCSVVAPAAFGMRLPRMATRWFLVGRDASEELVERVRSVVASVDAGVLVMRLREVMRCDVRKELKGIKVPALALLATEDHLVKEEAIWGQVEVVRVRGPHLILQARTEESVAILVEFLGRVESNDKKEAGPLRG